VERLDERILPAGGLTLTPGALAPWDVGAAGYDQQISVAGATGSVQFAVTRGVLPRGLTLDATTGLISGTPARVGAAGFVISAADGVGDTGQAAYIIRVNSALSIVTTSLPGWDATLSGYNESLKASGGTGGITFQVVNGALPAGLSLQSNGVLAGTPTTPGPCSFQVQGTDGIATATRTYAVTISAPLSLAGTNPATGDVGTVYVRSLPVTGGTGPLRFTSTPGLPAGLVLNGRTGVLRGTPRMAGLSTVTVTVTDAAGATASVTYTFAINPALTIKTLSLFVGQVGATYSQNLVVRGGTGSASFQLTGTLPPGLSLDANAGVLSGVPSSAGAYRFKITAADAAGAIASRLYSLRIVTAYAVPVVSEPGYLRTITDPTFGSQVTRIVGNPGSTIVANGTPIGTWSADARHNYNLNEAWNADGTLLYIENRPDDGGTPNQLYLNGNTYQLEFGTPSNMPGGGSYDQRWNPDPAYPDDVLLAGNDGSSTLNWFNVVTNTIDRTYTLPMPVTYIGNTKGNPSQDGRFICLGDMTHFFVVDMAAYPTERIGPVLDLASLGADGTLDSYSISPSGHFVVLHYKELNGQSGDFEEVLQVDPNTLALSPQPMPVSWPGMVGDAALGFVYDVGHEDMALDPFLGNVDVMIGQEHCNNVGLNIPGIQTVNSDGIGNVVMVQLDNGAVTSLTDPGSDSIAPEAYPDHVSCRAVQRPGWCYVSYYNEPGSRFSDEIIAIKMDGSGTVQQLADTHTDNDDTRLPQNKKDLDFAYRSEAHPVPSPNGLHILFASNWLYNGVGGNGIADYVIQLPEQSKPQVRMVRMQSAPVGSERRIGRMG
jgi:hypothetical protein